MEHGIQTEADISSPSPFMVSLGDATHRSILLLEERLQEAVNERSDAFRQVDSLQLQVYSLQHRLEKMKNISEKNVNFLSDEVVELKEIRDELQIKVDDAALYRRFESSAVRKLFALDACMRLNLDLVIKLSERDISLRKQLDSKEGGVETQLAALVKIASSTREDVRLLRDTMPTINANCFRMGEGHRAAPFRTSRKPPRTLMYELKRHCGDTSWGLTSGEPAIPIVSFSSSDTASSSASTSPSTLLDYKPSDYSGSSAPKGPRRCSSPDPVPSHHGKPHPIPPLTTHQPAVPHLSANPIMHAPQLGQSLVITPCPQPVPQMVILGLFLFELAMIMGVMIAASPSVAVLFHVLFILAI
ncbi:hypothetical protein FRB99_003190 [Tulasnella sp. 403]|nr:hypothetical protein FRB99_003190 [Tulasnella sp. 403]